MIAILGISHQSAPVSVRAAYAFDDHEKLAFADRIRLSLQLEGIVILSTCNRTELYINSMIEDENKIFRILLSQLTEFKNSDGSNNQSFYFLTNAKAVEQLFKVTSGLESLVLGEEQILCQVKDAFRHAQINKLTDCIISRLFIKAIESGKKSPYRNPPE